MNTTDGIEDIYNQYSGTVYGYLMRLCRNNELAQELTQETFYHAVRSIERFDGKCAPGTWLCSIAKHVYYNSLRGLKSAMLPPEELPAAEDFTEQIVHADQAVIAHRYLHNLEEPYREVFTLRTFCDLSHAQIAELFGKTESWSRVTYYRARRILQDAMKENRDEKE